MPVTLQPVVLSGGSGSRLWPMSRAMYPKQLLPMVSEQTLLQETISRWKSLKCSQEVTCVRMIDIVRFDDAYDHKDDKV